MGGVIAAVVTILGYYWNDIFPIRLPLFIDTAMTSTGFVYLGRYIKKLLQDITMRKCACVMIVSTIAFVALHLLCERSWSMQNNSYEMNIFVGYGQAIFGSMLLIALSRLLVCQLPVINFVGRNSLVVLCFHMFILMVVSACVKMLALDANIVTVPLFLMSVATFYPLVFIIRKMFKSIYN